MKELYLKSVRIKNFKSLRDTKLEFNKFNVIIGPNASGKSNIVEAFRLLKDLFDPSVVNPFIRYRGYRNIVWKHIEELPITYEFDFGEYKFSETFTGITGSLDVLEERFYGNGWEILIKGDKIYGIYEDKFEYSVAKGRRYERLWFDSGLYDLYEKINRSITRKRIDKNKKNKIIEYFEDLIKFRYSLLAFLLNLQAVRIIPEYAKKPSETDKYQKSFKFDGSNLHTLLFTEFKGRIPEEITDYLKIIFPDIERIWMEFSDFGALLKVVENGIEFSPSELSDGFYKMLSIFTLLSLYEERKDKFEHFEEEMFIRPLLIIDEIENSIHTEALEVVIDALKGSDIQVIITTHSPVVLDLVEPEDVIIVEKDFGETKVRKIENVDEIKNKLKDLGITLGESWVYGAGL
jgi:AAA15 family ATPase/GTPase